MKTLNQTILDAAREEVAIKHGYTDWNDLSFGVEGQFIPEALEEAALLAMEKQAEFYRWASLNGYVYSGKDMWRKPFHSGLWTELELYNIWREGK